MRRFIVSWIVGIHCVLFISSTMASKELGSGRVRMNGEILAAACAIEADSAYQVVNLGTLPIESIEKQGHSSDTIFTIRLTNCKLATVDNSQHQTVKITFDGIRESGSNAIAIQGNAQGVGLNIKDARGNRVLLGVPLAETSLSAGGNVLSYSLYLSKNQHQLKVGHYQATVRFVMEYL